MTRLGPKQLDLLLTLGTRYAQVTPTRETRRLCEMGLLTSEPGGGFARCTPDGLRAIADAVDAGRAKLFDPEEFKARVRQTNAD